MAIATIFFVILFARIVEGKFIETMTGIVRPTPPCVSIDLCGAFTSTGFKPNGNYRHNMDPTVFYTCDNGRVTCQMCPTVNLFYSEKCDMCLHEINDNLITCLTTQPWTTTTTTVDTITCDKDFCRNALKTVGIFENPQNQNKFYACVGPTTYCMDCPSNLIYDDSCKSCVFP